jgi:hypothetical protein
MHGQGLRFRRDEGKPDVSVAQAVWRCSTDFILFIKALMVTLIRQFSFSCSHEIEPFQSFVIRPRIKGQGPSSLPLLVRKVAF